MKTSSPPQSGKLGDRVASRNHYGYYLRRRPSVPPKPTPARNRSKSHFATTTRLWNSLTDAQWRAWDTLAKSRKAKATLGSRRHLTGPALFIKLNATQAAIGLPPLLDPAPLPDFDPHPVGEFTITRSGSRPKLQLAVPRLPAGHLRVSASPPYNRGRNRCFDFRLLGLLPPPVNGRSDLTALYRRKFGSPPPGKRIYLQIRQQLNGWLGLPLQASALVPFPPSSRRPGNGI